MDYASVYDGNLLPVGNWVWSARPFSRFSMDGKHFQILEAIDKNSKYDPPRIFELMAPDKLLIGNSKAVWLLFLNDTSADSNPSKQLKFTELKGRLR
jgi:hypothetical protein